MATLFNTQPMALQTAFAELKRQALEQPSVLVGSPGSVVTRTNKGRRFLYRDYYGPDAKKAADYIGPAGDAAAESRAAELREQIALANALIEQASLLAQHGYVRVDARTSAILAALANNGLFRAGALLVGSHAYGALLNELGVRAAATATEDVDVARHRRLALDGAKSFEEMLHDSRVALRPVPPLVRHQASASWKPPGPDRLRVDLLMPTRGDAVTVLPTPELRAHATALPWLGYLTETSMPAVVLGRSAMVPVHVPQPERLACHKMLVSQLRRDTSEKAAKDIEQAATLVAVLAEVSPEALEAAFARVPTKVRAKARRGARRVLTRLEQTAHQSAVDLVKALVK
ncbi:MAG: GSU2403 family nucleotidyltransferase fold protein [Polyangiaceae bacterium]